MFLILLFCLCLQPLWGGDDVETEPSSPILRILPFGDFTMENVASLGRTSGLLSFFAEKPERLNNYFNIPYTITFSNDPLTTFIDCDPQKVIDGLQNNPLRDLPYKLAMEVAQFSQEAFRREKAQRESEDRRNRRNCLSTLYQ